MQRKNGFTLIELLVTLAVIAILVTVGIPAFRHITASSDLSAHTALYNQAIHTARYLAVSSGRGVSLCSLDPQQRCDGNWNRDLTLFYDDARQGKLLREIDTILVVAVPGHEQRMAVSWRGFGERRFLNVRASGAYRQNGRFTFCPVTAKSAGQTSGKAIVINVTGRTRIEKAECPR